MEKQAFILAAGLGTRLRPWTLEHPKALVPVGGEPMLGRVIDRLRAEGFGRIVVNVHHFADQIVDYLSRRADPRIAVSDETAALLDTGGALLKASPLFDDKVPVLVHNVDILSDADLTSLYAASLTHSGMTLLVSPRESSRRLLFDSTMTLRGWRNTLTGEWRPASVSGFDRLDDYAFSGIYVAGQDALAEMRTIFGEGTKFSVIDYLLHPGCQVVARGIVSPALNLIDIGKPESLARANISLGRQT